MPSTALQARRERIRRIRRRMIGAGTAVFLATTGGILVQLSTGHDPALARSSATTSAPSTSSGAPTGSATAVTTSQS